MEELTLNWTRITKIYRRYLDVKRAWQAVKQVRRELRELTAIVDNVTSLNDRLGNQLEELRRERDELQTALGRYAIVDPNEKCPACGATDGKIQTQQSYEDQQAYVEHTCSVCNCVWPEEPVYADLAKMWAKPSLRVPVRARS